MKPSPSRTLSERLIELDSRASDEFVDISDYIWKAPRLLDHERKLELKKLDVYFPNHTELREHRWDLESHKLEHTFPYLIAVGNLFTALSLFESYLLLLAGELQQHTGVQIKNVKGQGVGKLFAFLRQIGINPERVQLNEQVQAAIKIRNCLMHASGMLDWSREHDILFRIKSEGTYLSAEHRKMRNDNGSNLDEVTILSTALGDKLTVYNQYCHVLCSYLRRYFSELCNMAQVTFNSTEA